MNIDSVGEKIKYYRTGLTMTQGRLAELAGIHPVPIRKYETNKMQPSLNQLKKIAIALNLDNKDSADLTGAITIVKGLDEYSNDELLGEIKRRMANQ